MKKFKCLLSILIATFLVINLNITSYAASSHNFDITKISDDTFVLDIGFINEMDETELKEFILSLGISEKEYNELISEQGISPRALPSNPKEGDTHIETTKKIPLAIFSAIGLVDGTATLAQVVKALKTGVSVASPIAYVALAGALIALGPQLAGYSYVQFEIHYRYGITNDGVLGWNIGPVYTILHKN